MSTILLLATIYGTLGASNELIKAPYASCVGTEYITNTTERIDHGVTNIITTVTTNYIWKETATLDEPAANRIGYKMVIDEPPTCASNEYAVAAGWEIRTVDGAWYDSLIGNEAVERIYRVYNKQMIPIAIPVYSVADLTFWAAINGRTEAMMNFLKSKGLYETYLTTQTFTADNEVFNLAKQAAVDAGVITQAELEAALEYSKVN